MKHWAGFLTGGLVAAASALFLAGCYTQMSASRGDDDEGYAQESQAPDQSQADTTSDYESARDRFYNDNYYGSDYPSYSVGIGFGWYSPWYGYGYPWYYYDGWPYSRWYYPYGYYSPAYYGFYGWPGYYGGYYGGHGYYSGYYGRPSATRKFGMIRSSGGSRGAYGTTAGPSTVMPSGSRSAVGATRSSTPGVRSRAATRYNSRPQRGVYTRPAQSGTPSRRAEGRTYSSGGSRGSAPASTGGGGSRGGGARSSGGGGGSRGGGGGGSHGGGGGGGSHGGGGRR